jgi:Meiotically up-regulated gene 113
MRFYISKRLPLGLRAGVLFDPLQPRSTQRQAPMRGIAAYGEGVAGVYVITGPHHMCKIGISTDPELRLATLQTGSHVALKLHYVLALQSIDPRMVESEAHRILDRYRCSGEWFDVTPQMAEDAVNQAAANFGIETSQTTSANPFGMVKKKRGWSFDRIYWTYMPILGAIFCAWWCWYDLSGPR